MEKYYLGIDIGTSSVKVLAANLDGKTISAKAKYKGKGFENGLEDMYFAVAEALKKLYDTVSPQLISAVGLSSQVGTYITDKGDVLPWYQGCTKKELQQVKDVASDDVFVKEIGMNHPDLTSYPLPSMVYIKRNFENVTTVCMPKEKLLTELTGEKLTDIFSQRGICNPKTGKYSKLLLEKLDIDYNLYKIVNPTDKGGYITEKASVKYGLPVGIPVYLGCNDFYAGLLGMGVYETETAFELSGTSEHMGVITKERFGGNVISGEYFNGYATYGGTKGGGASCDFAINNFGIDNLDEEVVPDKQPIFLPYLNGERAPIYDENAKGVFFGISGDTTGDDMAYAVLEGVVFSLYHIYEGLLENGLQKNRIKSLICGGGSASNKLMAKLKSELFDMDITHVAKNDSSALGAAIIAMTGDGKFEDLRSAVKAVAKYDWTLKKNGLHREKLLKRFNIYKSVYNSLKTDFNDFCKL